ncbi:MAG: T9SS type A sorting domain-containing protein [Bacteroidetes bacterium]|nr:T9SS type A sorting domain-containing protein [Bacteroidota bacterium]
MPQSQLDLTVYPNPTSEFLMVQINEPIENIAIYNMTGQKVLSAMGNRISVASLTAGMYLIEIQTEGGKAATRFVKE